MLKIFKLRRPKGLVGKYIAAYEAILNDINRLRDRYLEEANLVHEHDKAIAEVEKILAQWYAVAKYTGEEKRIEVKRLLQS